MKIVEAVEIAKRYLEGLPELLNTTSPRLEESEIDENGNWLVTLSFLVHGHQGWEQQRSYKLFIIDPEKKEVVAMKIRNPLFAL
jgi:hypothetical protein